MAPFRPAQGRIEEHKIMMLVDPQSDVSCLPKSYNPGAIQYTMAYFYTKNEVIRPTKRHD